MPEASQNFLGIFRTTGEQLEPKQRYFAVIGNSPLNLEAIRPQTGGQITSWTAPGDCSIHQESTYKNPDF